MSGDFTFGVRVSFGVVCWLDCLVVGLITGWLDRWLACLVVSLSLVDLNQINPLHRLQKFVHQVSDHFKHHRRPFGMPEIIPSHLQIRDSARGSLIDHRAYGDWAPGEGLGVH